MKTRRWCLRLVASAALGVCAVGPTVAGTVAGMGGSTELTQLMNNVELANQYAQQLQAYATQLQQWQLQVQNTLALPTQVWGAVKGELQDVARLVNDGQALAYSATSINDQFKRMFKGYPTGPVDYRTEYKNWTGTALDSLRSALKAANYQAEKFETEEGVLAQLRAASTSSDGQLKAMQVGAQIAEQQAQQLQKLRALMMAQMQGQNAYMAAQMTEKATIRGAVDDAVRYRDPRASGIKFGGGTR
jgi:P-type conjugative transfer protein TrbJ